MKFVTNIKKIITTLMTIFLVIGILTASPYDINADTLHSVELIYGYGKSAGSSKATLAITDQINTGYSLKGKIIEGNITEATKDSKDRYSQSVSAKTDLIGTEIYYGSKHYATSKSTSISQTIGDSNVQLFAVAYNTSTYYFRFTTGWSANPQDTKIIMHYTAEHTVSVDSLNTKTCSANNYYIINNEDNKQYEFYIPSNYSISQNYENTAVGLCIAPKDNFDVGSIVFTIGTTKYYYDGELSGTGYLNGSTGQFEDNYSTNSILKYSNGVIIFYKIDSDINIAYEANTSITHTITFHGLEDYGLQNPENKIIKDGRKLFSFNPLGDNNSISYNGLNYCFENWYSDEEFNNLFDFNTVITTDLDLYCKLEKQNTYYVTFNNFSAITSATDWLSDLDSTKGVVTVNGELHDTVGQQIQLSVLENASDNVSSIEIKIGDKEAYILENNDNKFFSSGFYLDLDGKYTTDTSDHTKHSVKYAHALGNTNFFFRFYNITSNIDIKLNYKQYTLTYISNGETYSTDTIYYGMSLNDLSLSIPDNPSKAGQVFVGWYLDENYQTAFDENTPIEGNKNVYAKFIVPDIDLYQQVILKNDGTLAINVKYELDSDMHLNYENALYLKCNNEIYKLDKQINENKQYYIYCIDNIAPCEMTKSYSLQLFVSNDTNPISVTNVQNISLSSCFASFINNYADRNVALVNFVKAMLNYGSACQKYFNVDTNNLANNILNNADKLLGNDYVVSDTNNYSISGVVDGLHPVGYNLNLQSKTDLKVYFKLDKNCNISDYLFKEGNTLYTPTLYENNTYYITIKNVAAPDLDVMHKIEITNNNDQNNELTVNVNPLSYVYTQLSRDNSESELNKMLKSLNIINQFSKVANKSENGEYVLSYYAYDEASAGTINKSIFYQNSNNEWLADPTYIYISEGRDAGYFYMYGTTASLDTACIGAWRSKNLTDWEFMGPVFIPDRTNGWQYYIGIWAPQIIYDNGKYYLFYSCPWGPTDENTYRYDSCCVSTTPYGPFREITSSTKSVSEPLLVFENHFDELPKEIQDEHVNHYGKLGIKGYIKAIGPSPFIDPITGEKYLFFCQDLSAGSTAASESAAYCIKMKNKNWSTPDYSTVTRITTYGKTTVGGSTSITEGSNTNEGPMCFYNEETGKYYLFFLTYKYTNKLYQTRIAVSDNVMGPYTKLQIDEGGQVMYCEDVFKRQASGIHGLMKTEDGQVFAAWMTFMNNVSYKTRKCAFDELVYVKNKDGVVSLQANGPSVTPQPLPKFISGYSNIADEAVVTTNCNTTQTEINNLKYLTDGVIPYHNNSLSTDGTKSVEFSTNNKTIEFKFEFEEYKTLRAVMVYNSKNIDNQFSQIDSITFNFRKNGEEASCTIGPVQFKSSYNNMNPAGDTVAVGAAAIAEFDELDVKSVIVTIKNDTGKTISIPEIYLLGKDYDGSSNNSKALTGTKYKFTNSKTTAYDWENCESGISIDGVKDSHYSINPDLTLNVDSNRNVSMYSFKGNDGLYLYFDVNEIDVIDSSSISNASHISLLLTNDLSTSVVNDKCIRLSIDSKNNTSRKVGLRADNCPASELEDHKYHEISFYSSIKSVKKTNGYIVELFIPYREFGITKQEELTSLKYELVFYYNDGTKKIKTKVSNSANTIHNYDPSEWTSTFTPSYKSVGLVDNGNGEYEMPYIDIPD